MKQTTIEAIRAYCELIKVPNWEERLKLKNEDWLFAVGVMLTLPANKGKEFNELREQMDHLLSFETVDEATADLRKKVDEITKDMPDVIKDFIKTLREKLPNDINIRVLGMGDLKSVISKDLNEMTEDSFNKTLEDSKAISKIEKISKLLAIGHKLGFDIKDSKYYDRMDDMDLHEPEYFNVCFVSLSKLMENDHYKTCDCISKKWKAMIFSNNMKEAANKIMYI